MYVHPTGYEPQQDHQCINERPQDEWGYVETLWFKLGGLQDEAWTCLENERFEVCFRLETGRKGRERTGRLPVYEPDN